MKMSQRFDRNGDKFQVPGHENTTICDNNGHRYHVYLH